MTALVATERPAADAAYANIVINERRFRDAKPINFGKASPQQLAVHGVDVSRWQGDIDWAEAARAGRQLRLHQGDRRRRPSRPDVQEELEATPRRPG